jgi:hypothetical protein
MTLNAFYGSADAKAESVQEIAAGNFHPGWSCVATDEERDACAQKYGLAPAFINLVAHAANVPFHPESLPYLENALAHIRPGADTLASVRGWALSHWPDVEKELAGTDAHAPALAIVRLVESSGSVGVPRQKWREARAALSAIKPRMPGKSAAIDYVNSMAWDLTVSPRATTDIWNALQACAVGPANFSAGWDKDAQDDVWEEYRRVLAHVGATLGLGAEQSLVQAQIQKELETSGYAQKFAKLLAHVEVIRPLVESARERGLRSILEACAADSQAA